MVQKTSLFDVLPTMQLPYVDECTYDMFRNEFQSDGEDSDSSDSD
jgi:hypothetical protein